MKNSTTTCDKQSSELTVATKAARGLVTLIHWYQQWTNGRVSHCRFVPSCSSYALEAIETHGALKGSALALRRLSRCRPFGSHGVDLVPLSKKS